MTRVGRSAVAVVAVLAVAGCGGTSHTGAHPVVIANPKVDTGALPGAELRAVRAHGALFVSPTGLAFMTSGTTSCVWLPARLVVVGPSEIRLDMRVNGDVTACSSGAVAFPITVTIPPRLVDVHHPLTVHLAYAVTVGGHTRTSQRTAVAPALGHT